MNLRRILSASEENRQLTIQVERLKDSVISMARALKDATYEEPIYNLEGYIKGKRVRNLELENKKLKDLIKSQIEKAEDLRYETFDTVEDLKSEFMQLVGVFDVKRNKEKQINQIQKEIDQAKVEMKKKQVKKKRTLR